MPDERAALASLEANGRLVFRVFREGELLVAEWPGMGVLRASEDGAWSDFLPAEGIDPRRAQKLRHGAVLALVRHLQGKLSLHGSSVALGGRALVCVGDPGAGKSTAAADLCRHAGAAFLADDVTPLDVVHDRVFALPSDESHWLLPDACEALGFGARELRKAPLAPAAPAHAPVPLAAIVQLAFDDACEAPVLLPIRGAARFAVLNASLFRFRIDSAEASLRDFAALVDLATRVPMFELRRPRHLTRIPQARELLASCLAPKETP